MKAVTYDPKADRFNLSELAIPTIGDNDVLIAVKACGLNPVDAKIHLWHTMAPQMNEQWVVGLDVSGEVVDIGAKVDTWRVGDKVLCHGDMMRPHGGFAEFTVQNADTLIAYPKVDEATAAATPCAGWTAWRALYDKLNITAHDTILITGGSGGVGGFAVQLARHVGLKQIIATCSSKNADYVKGLGATHVLDYHQQDIVQCTLDITNGLGVDIGLDTVGPNNDEFVANALRFEGQMVALVDTVTPANYQDAFMRGLSFHQLSLGAGHRNGVLGRQTLVQAGQAFSSLIAHGDVTVDKLQTIPLDDVPSALVEMRNQRTVGKIVFKA
ncbi:zinc-binding dehydrogenase [Thalassotalea agarivorans]|uniref:NADPH:quinone reductase n=1 Tax=Thalassotalea agarivorans TaxID=349064 RepID=A0A1I0EN09_THASX|nr:zinc-binding dehydrogenase [Thalassotalea agarivorans]SET46805.1 NADPH:quinone reductase [Thalassotalea agarivorans]